MKKKHWIIHTLVIVTSLLLLSACAAKPTPDVAQLSTQIAATIQADLTSTAMAIPTATPTLGVTPTPLQLAPTATIQVSPTSTTPVVLPQAPQTTINDNSKFLSDVNFPDGTIVNEGDVFTKTWKFENTGTTTWTQAYTLRFLEGNLYGEDNTTFVYVPSNVAPGKTVEVSVPIKAPAVAGSFNSLWKLFTPEGFPFGEYVTINIVVK